MPAALDVDHDKVRAVAMVVGVREAARQFKLKQSVVLQWSKREGWFEHKDLQDKAVAKLQEKQGITEAVKLSQVDVLANLGDKSKLVLAKTTYKTAKTLHKQSPEELKGNTQALVNTVKVGASLHGWESQPTHNTLVNINLGNLKLPDCNQV